jgi:hypothetical protein
MRSTLLLGTIAAVLLTGAAGCSKLTGISARNDFIAKANKLAFEVAANKPPDRRMSPDEVQAIFQGFIDASPEVELVGELLVQVVPFDNGGKNEPPELAKLRTQYKGNARNIAIRDGNVDLIGITAVLKAGGEKFTVEEWAYVADP